MEAADYWEYLDLGEPDTDKEAGMTESERAERAYERLVDDDESFVDMTIIDALAVSMATTITDEAVWAASDEAAVARHQEDLDCAITHSMEMVINDEAARAAADTAAAAHHQEDLDRAIADSMAMVVTNESASGATEVAGGKSYQEDLDHAALEGIVLAAMAGYKVVVILSDEE
jgi:ABC-type branched-subunit amino acid transport system ATPase component